VATGRVEMSHNEAKATNFPVSRATTNARRLLRLGGIQGNRRVVFHDNGFFEILNLNGNLCLWNWKKGHRIEKQEFHHVSTLMLLT
jgi:hypothetical protein